MSACHLYLNTKVPSENGLLTTVGYQLGKNGPVTYALEGSVAYCGSLVQWLRDNMCLIRDAADSEQVAKTVEDNGGVYFVPAFSGLFAPYWRTEARGLIVGLTAYNTRAHVTRAALEAAAFQVNEIITAMQADSGIPLSVLNVDGGMTKNNLAMQFQADILNASLKCPEMVRNLTSVVRGLQKKYYQHYVQLATTLMTKPFKTTIFFLKHTVYQAETTALGSAYAAGLAVGYVL